MKKYDKQTFDFNKSLIDSVIKNKLETEFAIWCKLKYTYKKKTIFYNWNYASVRTATGITEYMLRVYIKRLIALGWVEKQGNNLVVKSFAKLNNRWTKNRYYISTKGNWDVKEFITRLRISVIEKDAQSQKFVFDLNSNRIKTTPRRLRSMLDKWESHRHDKQIKTSYRRIARQLNISISCVSSFISKISKDGRISLEEDVEIINENFIGRIDYKIDGGLEYNGFMKLRNGNLIIHKGQLIRSIAQVC